MSRANRKFDLEKFFVALSDRNRDYLAEPRSKESRA
jgi:hypothetical protein